VISRGSTVTVPLGLTWARLPKEPSFRLNARGIDPRKGHASELSFFGGLSVEATAAVLKFLRTLSSATGN
jgi:hypothetical protein